MSLTVEAVFDGKVFQPDSSLDLPVHQRYTLTIEPDYRSVPIELVCGNYPDEFRPH